MINTNYLKIVLIKGRLLSIRKKWNLIPRNFKVGDLVLINTPDTRMPNWTLDQILETHQGTNDVVWTVKLKTRNGEMVRSASKLALQEAMVE